jgi:hypothetical protein
MSKSFSEKYQRLAGGFFGLSSLWLGDDHLVYVKGSGFLTPVLEEYKRFRLSEIEAINVAKTSRVGMSVVYLGALLFCAAVVALFMAFGDPTAIAVVVFLSVFLLGGLVAAAALLRHLILGPTCVCDLQTRLTRERLRPLNRYHRTLETILRVEPLVRQSQAGVVAVEGRTDESSRLLGSRAAGPYQIPTQVSIAFSLFAFLGFAALAALHLESLVVTGGVLLLLLGASLTLTVALVAVVRKPTPESIRGVLWILLGIHFLVVGAGAVYFVIAAAREPAYTVGATGSLEAFTAIAAEGGWIVYGLFVALFLGFAAAGGGGLALVAKWKRQIRQAAALVATEEEGPPTEQG